MRSGPKIEVPTVLSKTQIEFFVENGYLAVPDLISSSEIEELRADTLKLARGGYPCESLQPVEAHLSDNEVLKSILCIHQPHFISEVIERSCQAP